MNELGGDLSAAPAEVHEPESDGSEPASKRIHSMPPDSAVEGMGVGAAGGEPMQSVERIRDSEPQLQADSSSKKLTAGSVDAGQQFPLSIGAYTQREEVLLQQEAEGEIAFKYVYNDGAPHNMMYLTGLKNIFSKQLPNMPKEYICRLVFDRRHRSSALVKRNGTVVGGITYRAFHSQGFGEIAFCAITSSEQVKGYGTRLMNYTKEFARTQDKLSHFLTYADNNAVGYFTKQGFTKEIFLDRTRWYGFIKDYDGGTLMECCLHPKISYIAFPAMIKQQRNALEAQIRTISNSHVVHPGLGHHFQAGADAPSVSILAIPGVKEAGWTPEPFKFRLLSKDGVEETSPATLQRFMVTLLDEMIAMEESWPFLHPVDPAEVPDYFEFINYPIDLSMMKSRLESRNYYINLHMFAADFARMIDNCRLYNSSDTIFYKLAARLEAAFKQYYRTHVIADTKRGAASEEN